MYSKVLRALSLLLALIMLSAVVISCDNTSADDNTDNEATDTPSDTGIEKTDPTDEATDDTDVDLIPLPELDLEGEEITILIRDNTLYSREWYKKEAEDELDESVAMRNADVMDTLNVKLKYEFVPDASRDSLAINFNRRIADDINSGTHKYDIAANAAYAGTYTSVRGYAADLNDKELFPYFDFSLPCWNQSIVKNTTINGRLHYIAGYMNLSMIDSAMVIWCNHTLYDQKREESDPQNLLTHVLSGNWTYADLYSWAARLSDGSENDGTYLFAMQKEPGKLSAPNPSDVIPYAWDLDFIVEAEDGTHSFNFVDNDKAEIALKKFKMLITEKNTTRNGTVFDFAAEKYLFFSGLIYPDYDYNTAIREMESKYNLFPWPKYEASQENYASTAQDTYTLMSVLDHSKSTVSTRGTAISAYLQLSSEETASSVIGYYYYRIIKPKYFGTDDYDSPMSSTIAVFDMIVDNIELDYWTIYSPQLNNVAWLWRDTVNKEGVDLKEAFLEDEKNYLQALKDTDAWLGLTSNQ